MMEMIDMDALWRDMVLKHTKGGACNFRNAAFEFSEQMAKRQWQSGAEAPTAEQIRSIEASTRNHIMSDAVLLRTVAYGASNLSDEARAQLLAISEGIGPAPSQINPSIEAVTEWIRNHYQDHNIGSLCDALHARFPPRQEAPTEPLFDGIKVTPDNRPGSTDATISGDDNTPRTSIADLILHLHQWQAAPTGEESNVAWDRLQRTIDALATLGKRSILTLPPGQRGQEGR